VNADDRQRLLREVEGAGQCSHPIRLRGEAVNLATGEVEPTAFKIACKDRREAVCPACSRRYATDAWIIAATGLNGGKGVDESVADRPKSFVTLTAPSFGATHRITPRGGCVKPRPGRARCHHGRLAWCGATHVENDPLLGQALCTECFDFVGAVLWNAHASRLWTTTVQQARRNLASDVGVRREVLHRVVRMHYLKVAEMQRRGLVHFHALIRLDEVESGSDVFDFDELAINAAWRRAVKAVALEDADGVFRWGTVLNVQGLGTGEQDTRMVATYLAKYVTKTSGDALELARRFDTRRDITLRVDNPHLQRMALRAWDLADEDGLAHLRLRDHAHTLGFAGQLLTKSRAFSTTFGALRQARIDFNVSSRPGDPIEGSFHYDGRGYDDARASELADTLSRLEAGLRIERVARDNERRLDGAKGVGHDE
jgi:hypothetical protein